MKVRIAGVDANGDMIPARALCREALVDTGSMITMVSREVAEAAELTVSKRAGINQTAGGRRVRYYPAAALVRVAGCGMAMMTVAVSGSNAFDDVTVILGRDYMERTRMVVGPHDRLTGCTTYTKRNGKVLATVHPKRSRARQPTAGR